MEIHLDRNTHQLSVLNQSHQQIFSIKAYDNESQMGLFDWISYIFCGFERVQVAKDVYVYVDRSEVNQKLGKYKANPIGDFREKAINRVLNDILIDYQMKLRDHKITLSAIPTNLRKESPIIEQIRRDTIASFEANPKSLISIPYPLTEDRFFLTQLLSHPRFNEINPSQQAVFCSQIAQEIIDDHIDVLFPRMPVLLTRVKDEGAVIDLLKINPEAHYFIHHRLFDKPGFVDRVLSEVPALKSHIEFLKKAVSKKPEIIGRISNPEILLRVSTNPAILKHINPVLLNNRAVATTLINMCPELIKHIRPTNYLAVCFVIDLIKHHYVDDTGHERYRVKEELFSHLNPAMIRDHDFQSKLCWFSDGLSKAISPKAIVERVWLAPEKVELVPKAMRCSRPFYEACQFNRFNHNILIHMFHEIEDKDVALVMIERDVSLFNRLNRTLIEDASFQEAVKRSWKIQPELRRALSNGTISSPIIARNFLR